MSDTNPSHSESYTSKAPSHLVYHVRDRDGKSSYWTRIGAAWSHKDGNGFNVQIETIPLDGRLTLRTAEEKKD